MTTADLKWGFPLNSRKAHVFDHRASLCRRWKIPANAQITVGNLDEEPKGDECLLCWRAAKKRELA